MHRKGMKLLAGLLLAACALLTGAAAEEEPLYPIRKDGLWGYMNRAGETVIQPRWSAVYPFDGETALAVSRSASQLGERAGDTLIDRQGNEIIPPQPGLVIEEYPYAYRLRAAEGEGFYDKLSGFCLLPNASFRAADLWGEDGKGPVAVENEWGNTGYIDRRTGETVIPFRYSGESEMQCFRNGYALPAEEITTYDENGEVASIGLRYHLIDMTGREISFPEGVMPCGSPAFGRLAVARSERFGSGEEAYEVWKEGLGGTDGTVITVPCYDAVRGPDEEGMVCILQRTEEGEFLCGHMDCEGRVIVPPRYRIPTDGALPGYSFQCGYALFETDDLREGKSENKRNVILSADGREVFSFPVNGEDGRTYGFTRQARVMPGGLVWYAARNLQTSSEPDEKHTQYGLIRIDEDHAAFLTEPVFEAFGGSLKEWGSGEEAFSDGLYPVRQNGKWGYIDEQGAYGIRPAFDEASPFREGLALVQNGDKLAYIDTAGRTVWQED